MNHTEILTIKTRYLFLFLCSLVILISLLSQNFILTEDLYFSLLGEQMAYDWIEEYLVLQEKWLWVGYVITPLVYLLKLSLVTFSLLIGVVALGVKINFKQLFKVALLAEFVILIPALIKLFWFLFIDTTFTFEEVSYFMPLSLSNLFEAGELPIWWSYPLQLLSVFELAYWIALAYGIGKVIQESTTSGLRVVLAGYLPSLILWVFMIIFLQINIS